VAEEFDGKEEVFGGHAVEAALGGMEWENLMVWRRGEAE
jgi:hypothetical protein